MEESYRIAEVYEDFDQGRLECAKGLKDNVLKMVNDFGVVEVDGKRWWRDDPPVQIVDEINECLLSFIDARQREDGAEMTEMELDYYRRLRVQMFLSRSAIRKLMGLK